MCGKSTLDNLSFDHNPLSRFTFFLQISQSLKIAQNFQNFCLDLGFQEKETI